MVEVTCNVCFAMSHCIMMISAKCPKRGMNPWRGCKLYQLDKVGENVENTKSMTTRSSQVVCRIQARVEICEGYVLFFYLYNYNLVYFDIWVE